MSLSAPRLHAPVLALEQYDLVAPKLATIATMRLRMGLAAAPAPITTSVSIPLTTVSLQTNFDAMIHITYPWRQGAAVELMVDSGNASLIVPSFDDIAHLPNAAHAYRVLARREGALGLPGQHRAGPDPDSDEGRRRLHHQGLRVLCLHRPQSEWREADGQFRHGLGFALAGQRRPHAAIAAIL